MPSPRSWSSPTPPSSSICSTCDVCARAGLLTAQIDIAVATGDVPTVRGAADELAAIAREHPGPAFTAAARSASGALCLLENDLAGASIAYQEALRAWQEVGAPYEAARTRVGLGRALTATGSGHAAALELSAARATFERLGARLDMGTVDDLLAGG
jgi:hypothetical protein